MKKVKNLLLTASFLSLLFSCKKNDSIIKELTYIDSRFDVSLKLNDSTRIINNGIPSYKNINIDLSLTEDEKQSFRDLYNNLSEENISSYYIDRYVMAGKYTLDFNYEMVGKNVYMTFSYLDSTIMIQENGRRYFIDDHYETLRKIEYKILYLFESKDDSNKKVSTTITSMI